MNSVPAQQTTHVTTIPAREPESPLTGARHPSPLVVDTRPIFHRGETPCHAIDAAVDSLAPGQTLVLLVPFEPVPLYAKLGRQGFSHQTKQLEDGAWSVEFRR